MIAAQAATVQRVVSCFWLSRLLVAKSAVKRSAVFLIPGCLALESKWRNAAGWDSVIVNRQILIPYIGM